MNSEVNVIVQKTLQCISVDVPEKNIEVEIEITYSCAICMTQHLRMKNIFDNDADIADRIFYCTGIQLTKEDGLPSVICTGCLEQLSVAHKFKTSCVLAYDTFQSLLKSEVKVEFDDSLVNSDVWEAEDTETSVKEELTEVCDNGDVVLEECNSAVDVREDCNISVIVKRKGQKRGPYKKSGQPRLKKLKFKRLWCEPCSLRFASKQLLEDHRKVTHSNCEDSWVCEICGKVFVYRGSLTAHIRSHLPPQFACDQCEYKTWNKYDLVKHLRIHKGEKLYQCQHCACAYYTSSNLTGHIRRIHKREKRFACDLCERQFYDKTKFRRHIDSHNNVKRFECEVCHSCFTRRCYWKKHLERQHSILVPAQRPGKQKVNFVVGQKD